MADLSQESLRIRGTRREAKCRGGTVPALLTHHGIESCRVSGKSAINGTNPCCLRHIAYAAIGLTYYSLSHGKVYINFEETSPVDSRNILYQKVTLNHHLPYTHLKNLLINLLESTFIKAQWVSSSSESFSTASTSSRQYPSQAYFQHSLTRTEKKSVKTDMEGDIKTTTKTPQTTPCPTKNHPDALRGIPHRLNTNLRAPSIKMRSSCIATCQKGSSR